MFRDLIPLLADRFHIIAPDLPGFGKSDMPGRGHTFDRIAQMIDRFTEMVGFDRYAVYVFDYGAPTGFRLAAGTRTVSPRSSPRTETPTRKGLATAGTPFGPIGRTPRRPTARRCAPS